MRKTLLPPLLASLALALALPALTAEPPPFYKDKADLRFYLDGDGKPDPAGVGGRKNLHYALELAERGYVTLAPDYPGYGGYKIDVYAKGYASATMKGIVNHRRAVDLLQSLPEVDATRIGCVGHSL